MRYLSWLLSFLLHVTIAVVLLQTIRLEPFDLRDVLEVDLTEVEVPEVISPMPMPSPPEPLAMTTPSPETPAVPAPLPQDKTIVLDDSPPSSPEPQALAEPEPLPEPDVVEISPVKVPPEPEEEDKPKRIIVRKNDTIVHRGHEARFGRAMMGDYYSYEATEFSGNFKARDDRTISIIDARKTKYGRFLIYDSKNKTLRRLKEVFKYVYTIGPSVYEDEPVIGSVTFLAKNDRIERFIIQTDDDRLAYYPRKVHVREEEVHFSTSGGERTGYISLPPTSGDHAGVVFVHGNQCVDPGLVQGFTRALSMHSLASISFLPKGCDTENGEPESVTELVTDTLGALDHFSGMPQMKDAKIGLWGNGQGVPVVLKSAMAVAKVRPAYAVCLLDDTLSSSDMPQSQELAALNIPVFWLITGRDVSRWQPLITTLESLRDNAKKQFAIVVAPLKASQEVLAAKSEQSGWVENVTEDHARLAVSWIRALNK